MSESSCESVCLITHLALLSSEINKQLKMLPITHCLCAGTTTLELGAEINKQLKELPPQYDLFYRHRIVGLLNETIPGFLEEDPIEPSAKHPIHPSEFSEGPVSKSGSGAESRVHTSGHPSESTIHPTESISPASQSTRTQSSKRREGKEGSTAEFSHSSKGKGSSKKTST